MKEFIERAAVKDEILSWAVCINHPELVSKEDTMYCIDSIPAADVVEVVRCRDCVHYKKGSCNLHSVWPDQYSDGYDCRPDDDDFCSYGER